MFSHIKNYDIKGTIERVRKRSIKENLLRFLGMKESASKIALSISIGLLVGFVIPMGFETIVSVPLAVLFRCNPVLAVMATWVTNPITIIPLYYSALKVGEYLTHTSLPLYKMQFLINNPSLDSVINLGLQGVSLILLGCLILGIIAALLGYFLVYNLVVYFRKKFGMELIS